MDREKAVFQEDFNPTFLFTWKGIRTEDEKNYHCHEHLELCYVQSGRGRHRIDGVTYEIGEGDLIVINAGVYHQALAGGAGGPVVEFYVGLTDICLAGLEKNRFPLRDGCPVFHLEGELKLKISKLCVGLEAEQDMCRSGRYYMMKTYAMQMLLLLLREEEQPAVKQQPGQYSFESVNRKYLVERIMDYFEDHYEQKISLDQIACNMYLSPFYVSRIFKAETGDTPIHFLIDIRLSKARKLLLEKQELSIQEVAASVGYDDAYHFSKLFKKKYGVAPSAVRRREG
ncbi:MAG: AraC family transcriptional regulator [Eubacteriales bacterium]|nr:AraC family transcriptional regulator [Eubacteriales bacterium]